MTNQPPVTNQQGIAQRDDTGWNFADLWENVAFRLPDALAQQQGDRTITWDELNRRANGVAAALLDTPGAAEQDKVTQYLYNCPEYLESTFAAFKAGFATVNTNYRYAADELVYLWDNGDVTAVVFHGTFADTCDAVRERVPRVRTWFWVDDGSGPCPDWAVDYAAAAAAGTDPNVSGPWGRSGDHLLLLYTGGTTGMPKGVMWRQDDLFAILDQNNRNRMPPEQDLGVHGERLQKAGPRNMPGAPLMHGTGLFNAISNLMIGGSITTIEGRHFDPVEFLGTIEHHSINSTSIVGDAFAKPILAALDAEPERWTLDSVLAFTSSGVMWSEETKQGMLAHQPKMLLADAFSSSEALGMGQSVSGGGAAAKTARFQAGAHTIVIDDLGNRLAPGTEAVGRLAVGGRQPIGYYKDPEKSARTFMVIDGKRYSCPGDYATIGADGVVSVLGRGSVCINSGGEKIFPEEVEEALKTHLSVADAVVVGVPHERFGEMVVGVVQYHAGTAPDPHELIEHVRERLAAYKAPRHIVEVDTIGRAANGKVDYKRLREHAVESGAGTGTK